MTTQITKFKQEEKLRRLYFKYRGDVLAIAREAGLENQIEYVRKITGKIKRGFKHDVNFEIACFVTDALLAGREQRLILMEDRLKELLSKKELVSVCCTKEVSKHSYEDSTWYKCKKCGENCETTKMDCVIDVDVVRYLDRMRKEDELIYKFMVTMGFISKMDNSSKTVQSSPTNLIESESKSLTEDESLLLSQLQKMNGVDISDLRNMLENKIKKATQDNTDAER